MSEVELKDIIDDKLHHDFSFLEDIEKEVSANRTKSLNDNVCTICDSSLCISPNGNVFPCVGWTDKILGSLNKYFLEDIWNSSEEIKKLRSIKNKDFSECISCNQKDFCTICMVRNSNESSTGNPFEVNRYFCTIARIKKQLYEETNQGHKLKTST